MLYEVEKKTIEEKYKKIFILSSNERIYEDESLIYNVLSLIGSKDHFVKSLWYFTKEVSTSK